jgi:hypothetical protein
MHTEYKVLSPTIVRCNKFDKEENDQDVCLLVESLLKVLIAFGTNIYSIDFVQSLHNILVVEK